MSLFAGTELYRPPTCPKCERLESECECPPEEILPDVMPPEKQTAMLRKEKRKKGKVVSVIRGLAEGTPEPFFGQLLKELKNHCGSGGSIQGDSIEIQGDHLQRLREKLQSMGYRVKLG